MAPLLISLIVSFLLTHIISRGRGFFAVQDVPNERSLHTMPTPRLGGLAILVACCAGWLLIIISGGFPGEFAYVALSALLVAVVSLVDDYLALTQVTRFSVHLIAAMIAIAGTVYQNSSVPMLVFYAVATIWLINLYNFMDGMDGFSGGMAVFGFLGFAVSMVDAPIMAHLALVVAVSSLGFLCFNFPPAKIFMGDVGSATLGMLVAGFSLWGVKASFFPIWLPLLIFSPFIVDASITILRRALNREKIWLPHRKHFYQRLVQNGWSHRKTVLCEYILMVACAASAIFMNRYDLAAPGLVVWVITYFVLAILVERKVRDRVPFCS